MRRVVVLVTVLIVAGGVAWGWLYLRIHEPFRGYQGSEQFVEIPTGAGGRTIGERLVASGVVRDEMTYRFGVWRSGQGRRLKAGEYRFDHAMTPLEVVDKLARGDVYVVNVTFPEGLNVTEMSKVFAEHGLGPASAFVEAARNPSPIHDLDPSARGLEGYLFPSTYPEPRHTDAAKLIAQMTGEFAHALTPDMRQAAEARGRTVHQVVTLASIVEKEAARPDERPMVAAVYENRLRIGMPLQCDPTVIYALELAGRYSGNLHHDDLMFDSPYNTYRYPGLPPGPIASPGRASLDAAIHPADVDFLYFVSRNDGTHAFAHTLEEHNRNVQKWQVEYFRNQRRQAAARLASPGR